MEYKVVDVLDRDARVADELVDRVADGIDAKLEDATAVHGKHAFAVLRRLIRRGACQSGDAQCFDVRRRRKLNGKGILSPSLYDRSGRAIAKEHARGTVGPIERARHLLGGNDQHVPGPTAGDIALGDIERKYETGTGRRDIEGRTYGTQALSNGARFGGDEMIARRRRTDDKIQLARMDSRRLERLLARCHGKVVERLGGAHMAALDPRAGKNPLIRGVQELGQLVVGNAALRKCRARSQYRETHR